MMLEREAQEQCKIFGMNSGKVFDDRELAPRPILRIVGLNIHHGMQVDAIQATYQLVDGSIWTAPKHGGDGGSLSQFVFDPAETMVAIVLTCGCYIDSLEIVTQLNGAFRRYGPCGGGRTAAGSIIGAIVSLHGRSGKRLDALGVWGYSPLVTSRPTQDVPIIM